MIAWILVGLLNGSIVTSGHETREACEGRAVMLREAKVAAKCVEAPPAVQTYSYGSTTPFVLSPSSKFCMATTCSTGGVCQCSD